MCPVDLDLGVVESEFGFNLAKNKNYFLNRSSLLRSSVAKNRNTGCGSKKWRQTKNAGRTRPASSFGFVSKQAHNWKSFALAVRGAGANKYNTFESGVLHIRIAVVIRHAATFAD